MSPRAEKTTRRMLLLSSEMKMDVRAANSGSLHTLQTEKLIKSLKETHEAYLHVSHRSLDLSFGSLYSEFISFIYLFIYLWHILHH